MTIHKIEAIKSLAPKAEVIVGASGVVTWHNLNGETQPTEDQITAEINRLETQYTNDKYKRDRAVAYDPITEQLDQLYWDKKNGTNKWVEAIDKIKSDNPKP
tara:strand:- start:1426 stop:1731 length:306 start_codon:yes stop_codon:yes gene_type:complete